MAELFNFSEAARIALHAVVLLARRGDERWTIGRLARVLGVSAAHLAKVMAQLERSGLVQGKTGPAGGYQLARPAEKISLLAVYEAVAGKMVVRRCPLVVPVCAGDGCALGEFLVRVNRQLVARLQRTTVGDIKIKLEVKDEE